MYIDLPDHEQLRQPGQQLNIRSGLKPVFQNHTHKISPNSLENFIRSWEQQQKKKDRPDVQILDPIVVGTRVLQKNILQDKNKNTRYRWGNTMGSADVEIDEVEEEGHSP